MELGGARQAHLRDGVALVRLLHWLATADPSGETELSVAEKLDAFRTDLDGYRSRSFETIVGFGPNSAVGHYKLNRDDPQRLAADGVLLIDCGAQFPFGTTDTTRTLILGTPTTEQVDVYTTVLKCLIMVSGATFPAGTTGQRLDALGRYHLWARDWECRHGIGHGVGSYLHVHEGPQRINKANDVVFEPGMVNSCEPGVYFAGDFGVRLENMIVTQPKTTSAFGTFHRFETLTMCPFDRRLIDTAMLTASELAWLNAYHGTVHDALAPHLDQPVRAWLERATAPLGQGGQEP